MIWDAQKPDHLQIRILHPTIAWDAMTFEQAEAQGVPIYYVWTDVEKSEVYEHKDHTSNPMDNTDRVIAWRPCAGTPFDFSDEVNVPELEVDPGICTQWNYSKP